MDSIFKGMIQALVFVGLMSLRNNRCPQDLKFDLNKKNVGRNFYTWTIPP